MIDGVSIGPGPFPATYTFTNITANHTIDVQFCNPGCTYTVTAFAGNDASICEGLSSYSLAPGDITIAPALGGFSGTWTTSGDGIIYSK